MKKIFSIAIMFCLLLSGLMFSGCSNEVGLKKGDYEIVAYSVNGAINEDMLGQYLTINDSTCVDWSGNVATYTVEDDTITLYWTGNSGQVLQGKIKGDSIIINETNASGTYMIEFKYKEDAVLKTGLYEIVVYSIDGVSNESVVGQCMTINDSTVVDMSNNVATYTIKGDTITLYWTGNSGQVLQGKIKGDSIIINETNASGTYIIEFKYKSSAV